MKRKICAIILGIAMIVSVTGCGETGAMPVDEVKEDATEASDGEKEAEASSDDKDNGSAFPDLTENGSDDDGASDTDKASDDKAEGSVFDDDAEGSASDDKETEEDGGLISVPFYLNQYDDEDQELYFMNYGNNIICSENTRDKYPKLAEKLEKIAKDCEKDHQLKIDDNAEDAKEFAREAKKDGGTGYYSYYSETALKRFDDKAVSILKVQNGFFGGAHPDYVFDTINLDPETGKEYVLSDIIKDKDELDKILINKLEGEYPDVEFFDLKDTLKDFHMDITGAGDEELEYAYEFTLDPDGICFYFDPYGISAYAYGDQVVKITYDEAPDLFKRDFAMDGGYISYFPSFYTACYDLHSDGVVERMSAYQSDYEENDMYTSLSVTLDDNETTVSDTESFNMVSALVHTDDKKDYMYLITQGMDDYRTLYVIDMNGEKPNEGGNVSQSYRWFKVDDYYGEERPVDPDDLHMATRMDMLSTYEAGFECEIDDKGMPEKADDYYTIPENSYVLKSKEDLNTTTVDENGKEVDSNLTVPAGQYYMLYRTDGKKFVDAKLASGEIVRLYLTKTKKEDYGYDVNDQYWEFDLFETLYYAS